MYQADTEILFPMRIAPELRDLRGSAWRELVEDVLASPQDTIPYLAFNLLLIRLSNCLSCHTYSYRAIQGCTRCAIHTINRFPGSDEELLSLYRDAAQELHAHFELARPVNV